MKLYLLALMLFLHIINDFCLQGWLANAKQRDWWQEAAPQPLYKNDWVMALAIHSFSWAFTIMLVPFGWMWYLGLALNPGIQFLLFFSLLSHTSLHMLVDHFKANTKSINLVQDQLMHFAQVTSIWLIFCCIIVGG